MIIFLLFLLIIEENIVIFESRNISYIVCTYNIEKIFIEIFSSNLPVFILFS